MSCVPYGLEDEPAVDPSSNDRDGSEVEQASHAMMSPSVNWLTLAHMRPMWTVSLIGTVPFPTFDMSD